MTGVINVGARLPAVIFPVVIRPSGGLTPLISLSVSLVCLCPSASLRCSALSLFVALHILSVISALPLFISLKALSPHLYTLLMSAILLLFSLTFIHLQPLSACCPWPLHPSLCNGNPLMYAAILLFQYVN